MGEPAAGSAAVPGRVAMNQPVIINGVRYVPESRLLALEAENAQLRADVLAKVKEVFERSRLTKQRAARSTQQEVLHE